VGIIEIDGYIKEWIEFLYGQYGAPKIYFKGIHMEIKYRTDLNKLLPANPITAEIGCAEGLFSEHILKNWNPLRHYMVDLWECIPTAKGDGSSPKEWHDKNYKEVKERVQPFEEKVHILRGLSWRMNQYIKDESLDLVYLDAGHYYEAVMKDLQAWYPTVRKGGIVAGHDYANKDYQVFEAVQEFIKGANIEVHLIAEDHWSNSGFWFYKP